MMSSRLRISSTLNKLCFIFVKSKARKMQNQITIVKVKRKASFDLEAFEESAKLVLEQVVKPQIKHAANVKIVKDVVRSNNPV